MYCAGGREAAFVQTAPADARTARRAPGVLRCSAGAASMISRFLVPAFSGFGDGRSRWQYTYHN